MEDKAIIELYFARNEKVISETDIKYGKYCSTIANNILNNREDTDECVNDTYMQTWNSLPPQRPSILKAFLGKITRNLALNLYKKQHTKKRYDGIEASIDELEECIANDFNLEEIIEINELTSIINDYLATLKDIKRKILVERYWYISSVKEIAEKHNLSESNVKMTLARSREELKVFLEKRGVFK